MFRSISLSLAMAVFSPAWGFEGVGRPATAAEIAAWDIDVRPDLMGLPKGSGSVKQGERVWDAKCASCHGTFGESNEFYPPIAGGVTAQDIASGRVAGLAQRGEQRTTLMKLSQISTLWDYINRAMPWNAPRSLSVEEVYAVTAYILHFDAIVPENFVLSDANMAAVQRRLPNRDGKSRAHGLWDVKGRPDVSAKPCMRDCAVRGDVISALPAYVRGYHGDLAEQTRTIGPVRGMSIAAADTPRRTGTAEMNAVEALAERSGCLACHGATTRVLGPSLAEIATRYADDSGAEGRLVAKVREGGQGEWGIIPMPPHPQLQRSDAHDLVRWMLSAR